MRGGMAESSSRGNDALGRFSLPRKRRARGYDNDHRLLFNLFASTSFGAS